MPANSSTPLYAIELSLGADQVTMIRDYRYACDVLAEANYAAAPMR